LLFVIIGAIGASTSPAWATEVGAGFDLFMTTQTTAVDLSGFGLGIVPLQGDELLPGTDTIVERLAPAGVPNVGDFNTIPIELVALSLVSIDPVKIELLDFDIHVLGGSDFEPQRIGEMTINRLDPNGGNFSALLPVNATIHFLQVGGDVGNDFTVPFGDEFITQEGVWSETPAFFSCFIPGLAAGNFFAGVDPDTKQKVLTVEEASFAIHSVLPCMMMPPSAVGGELIPLDTTALLLAATYSTASWMIPLMIAAVGFGILITHQKTKLKYNSCPSCKLESDDIFELGDKTVGKCDNPKCRVSLFYKK